MLADTVIHLSYPLAFAAGLVSFLSPCVLPLLPAYLAYLGGRTEVAGSGGGAAAGAGQPALAASAAGGAQPAFAASAVGVGVGQGGLGASGAGGRPAGLGASAAGAGWRGSAAVGPAAQAGGGPVTARRADGDRSTGRAPLVANGVAFVAGFTVVFVAVFYVFAALGVTLFVQHRRSVEVIAGVLVTLLGLQTLGLFRVPALMRDARWHRLPRPTGLGGAFLLGVTFAAGWSPCIGPQLGLILTVAGERDFAGLPVMLVYASGLAVPFLLAAVLADRAQAAVRSLNRHLGAVNLVAGMVLVIFGLLLAAGNLTSLNQFGAPIDV